MSNFFQTFFEFSRPEYYGVTFCSQPKYQLFENVAYYISIERLFSTEQFLPKDLGVYDS